MDASQKAKLNSLRAATAYNRASRKSELSPIWNENWTYFKYMLSLGDDDIGLIRYHVAALNETPPIIYWHNTQGERPQDHPRVKSYLTYTQDIEPQFHIGEPVITATTQQHGIQHNSKIINDDIVRYQRAVANLVTTGILPALIDRKEHLSVIEIGGGYGGLAYQFGKLLPPPRSHLRADR